MHVRDARDKEILGLALPAFGALVAEPLFLLTDSAIVGHLGAAPLGGLGVAGQALTTCVSLCVFLAYGTTAAVARQVGAGRRREAVRQGVDGVWLALVIGIVIMAVATPLVDPIVTAFGASAAVASQAEIYLRVGLAGVPGMLVVLAGTGVLRGVQDTRTTLKVSVAMFAVNATLNAIFVLGLGWGIAGSAWGTVIAQTGGAVVYLGAVFRWARRYGAPLRPDRRGLVASAAAGAALLVRTACLRLVLVVGTSVAARMGTDQIAAYQAGSQIWNLLTLALDAIAIAGQAITGRYLGGGDTVATRAATRRMIEWGLGCGVLFGLLVLAARPVIPDMFSADARVTAELLPSLYVVAAMQPINGVVFVLDGILIGAGDARYLAWVSIVQTAAFLPLAWLVHARGLGLVALWTAIGVWMVARLITLGLRERGDKWLVTGAVRGRRGGRGE